MANPTPYSRDYSFAGFQANSPQTPLPGPKVDEELDNLGLSVNGAISGLADIRRADGALRNGIVTAEAMAPGIITGLNPATEWVAGKQYFVNDTVFYQVAFYRCLESHVSNADFLVDLTALRWEKYADLAPIVTDAEIARDQAVIAAGTAVDARDEAVAARDATVIEASTATGAAATATAAATSAAASYDLFDDRYLGEKTTLPTVDNDGNALVNGALVSLTGQVDPQNDGMYVRRGGAWQKMFASTNVLLNYARFSATDGNLTAGQTTFTISGGYISGYADVYRNGLKLVNGVDVTVTSGTQIVLAVGVGGSDVLEFEGYRVLDNVMFATEAEAVAGVSQSKIMSPYLAASALSARINYVRVQDDKYVQLGLDPTNTTDSFAALTQAFADAISSGKRHLVIAGGTYRQSGTITIGGDDFRLTFEEGAAIASAPGVFSPTMLSAVNRTGLRLENVNYVGNNIVKPGNKGQTPQAIYLIGCNDLRIIEPKLHQYRGVNIACPNCSDVLLEGGRFTSHGQAAGIATGDAAGTYAATPGYYGSGGRNHVVRNSTFIDGGFSGVFLFTRDSVIDGNYFENQGESAVYQENIDPATNNGFEVRGNSFVNNHVSGTHIVDISAAGFECMAHDQLIANNRVSGAGTHGIVVGLASRQVVQGNMIGNCNVDNQTLNAGICATVHTGVYNVASQQGDQISLVGNVIYDQTTKMKSGILWHSLDIANYVFRRAVDQGNSFQGLPSGKERDFTVGCMVDDPTLSYAPTIGPDSAWKKTFRSATGVSPTNATTATQIKATSIPPHYMLNNGGIRVKAEGDFINNINSTKNVRLYFQGAQVGNFATAGAGSWSLEVDIINTAYNAQQIIFRYTVGGVPAVAFSSGAFGTNLACAVEIRGDVGNTNDYVRCFSLSAEKITG